MKFNTSKTVIILLLSLSATHYSYSQGEENKWVIGLGANAVDFFPTNQSPELTGNTQSFWNEFFNSRDHWSIGVPKVHLTRHIKNKIAINASFTANQLTKIGEIKTDKILSYFALDASIQYSLLKNNYTYYPYVFVGGGYTSIDKKGTGTLNSGIGMTYWFSEKFGVNGHGMFKFSPEKYINVLQHFQYSLSIVHRFGSGRGNKDCIVTK